MPSISNITLSVQKGGGGQNRTVNVNYNANFTSDEVLANATFQVKAELFATGEAENSLIGAIQNGYVKATSPTVSSNASGSFTRHRLDEDPDILIFNQYPFGKPIIVQFNQRDEIYAKITLTPIPFGNASGNSNTVTGFWGNLGAD